MSTFRMVALGTLIKPAKIKKCGSDSYPVLSMTMHDGLVFQSEKFKKTVASKDTSEYKVVYRNQLVISFPIDEGVLAAQRIVDAGIVSPAYGIWDIDEEQVIPEFLEHSLRCKRALEYYKAKLRGSTARRRSLPTPTLLAFRVPLPSLQTQETILEIINKSREILNDRQSQLTELDALIKARFVEMFGDPVFNSMRWEMPMLGDCLESIENGKSFVCSNEARMGDFPAILKLSAATYGEYKPNENKALLDESLFASSAEVHSDDLLFTRKNTPELVGMCAYVVNTPPNLMMPDLIFRLNTTQKCNKIFLWKLINHDLFRDSISAIATGSAKSMSNISKERLGKLRIILPPIEEQERFADFVAQVDKSKAAVQKSLDEMQLLFDSFMQKYFG